MAEALHPLNGQAATPRRERSLLDLAPALTLLVFLLPVGAGLLGTLLPAFGHLPALAPAAGACKPGATWPPLRACRPRWC